MRCRAVLSVALAAGLAGAAVLGASRPGGRLASAAAKPFAFTADQISVDNRGTALVATGHVVVTFGTLRATSDGLRLNRAAGTAVFTGHVAVTDPTSHATGDTVTLFVAGERRVTRMVLAGHGSVESPSYALLADRIVADRDTDVVTADGHLTLYSEPDVIVTGAHATYDRRAEHAVILGDDATRATVQNRDGRILGSRLDLFRRADRLVVRGHIDADIYDAKLAGDDATVDLKQAVAVITGHVRVTRRQGTLEADRVTVFYRARRFIAEGTTHVIYRDSGDSTAP